MCVVSFFNGIAPMLAGRNGEIFANCFCRVSRLTMNSFSAFESEVAVFVRFKQLLESTEALNFRSELIRKFLNFSLVNAARVLLVVFKFMWTDTVDISCEKLISRLSTGIVSVVEIQLSLHDVPFEVMGSILNTLVSLTANLFRKSSNELKVIAEINSPLGLFELLPQGIHRSLRQF